jgi:hypothetical protein
MDIPLVLPAWPTAGGDELGEWTEACRSAVSLQVVALLSCNIVERYRHASPDFRDLLPGIVDQTI